MSTEVMNGGRFLRMRVALFLAGFGIFSLIYAAQPLLPRFAADFAVTPAGSSWALSITTMCLAPAILVGSALSESLGRRGLMTVCLCVAALFNLAAAFPASWHLFLILRALEGLALGGVPAVAMAYVSEETPPERLGGAMGLYVGGTALGGMTGRFAVSAITQVSSWRVAMGVLGVVDLFLAVAFFALLPRSTVFTRRAGLSVADHLKHWAGHVYDASLWPLFLNAALVMGAFVSVYNYAAFRLQLPPYALSQGEIGSIFLAYIFGTVAATLGGALSQRLGLKRALLLAIGVALLGVAITLVVPLAMVILGIVIVTIGFFTIQSVAGGGVGRMALKDKGHATSLYLVSYYIGASLLGSAGGWFWRVAGWPGVVGYTSALLITAALLVASGRYRQVK